MRQAHFEVSRELLREALHMPSTASIVACWGDHQGQAVNFIVSDYAIPEAPVPHECMPVIRENGDTEWDWNIKESE